MQAPLSSTASGKSFHSGPLALSASTRQAVPDRWRTPPQDPCEIDSTAERKGLAHDAGNLLGALGLYCELLALPGVLQEEHRHYARELQMLSVRSRDLIDRLLHAETTDRKAFARRRAAAADLVTVPDVLESCRGILQAVARRAVAVVYEAGAAQPVRVPRESLERILVNLTKNAAEAVDRAKAPSRNDAITIRVRCEQSKGARGHVVLTVEDKGCGMSAAAVRALRGEAPPIRSRGGHGIGFQVVRELVSASEGRLQLTSRIGDGTAASISWAVAAEMPDGGKGISALQNPFAERRRWMDAARGGCMRRLSC